jgi:hypothetical protein
MSAMPSVVAMPFTIPKLLFSRARRCDSAVACAARRRNRPVFRRSALNAWITGIAVRV